MLRRRFPILRLPRVRFRFTHVGVLLAVGAVAVAAPLAGGTQIQPAGVDSALAVKVKDVRDLDAGNPFGDDDAFPDGVLCLYDDRTWEFLGFCDRGRWIADRKKKNIWLQGGCEEFDVYSAIHYKNKKRVKGTISEWFDPPSPFTHIAAAFTAVRDAAADIAACEAAALGSASSLTPFLQPAGGVR